MAFKLFQNNLFGVGHALRLGRHGTIIKSIFGDKLDTDPDKIDEVKSNDVEILAPDETTLRNIRIAASNGYTNLSAGPTKERNKKRATNREEIETDFVRKTPRIVRELTFPIVYSTTDGTITPSNITNADIISPYPLPQNYILNSITIKCTESYNGVNPSVQIYLLDDVTNIPILTLTSDDLVLNEKTQIDLSYNISTLLTFNILQTINGSTTGAIVLYLTYYGTE